MDAEMLALLRKYFVPKQGGTTSFQFTPAMGVNEQTLISESSPNNQWLILIGCRLNLKALEDDGNTPNLTIRRFQRDNQDTDEDAETELWTNGTDPTVVPISDFWFDRLAEIKGTLSIAVLANATIYLDYAIFERS